MLGLAAVLILHRRVKGAIRFIHQAAPLAAILGLNCLSAGQSDKSVKTMHPSSGIALTPFYDVPRPLPLGKPGELIRSEPTNQYSLPYEISAFRILYHSRTLRDEDIAVSGVILIPDGKPPAGGWPVIAWAHEFKGSSRQSAPSLMKNLGVGPLLAMYANLGYAVVATDYAGLGASDGEPAVDAHANARDLIYSVTAARTAVKEIGRKWIAVGALQGAAATVAAAEIDLPDSLLEGSIAVAGPGNSFTTKAKVPLLVITGELDRAATPANTAKSVAELCRLGDRVLWLKYASLDSSGAIIASAADQISWIKARFAGAAAPSNCH